MRKRKWDWYKDMIIGERSRDRGRMDRDIKIKGERRIEIQVEEMKRERG